MSNWLEVVELSGTVISGAPPEPDVDVVFVHGLGSDAREAWTASNGHYWPQAVAENDGRLKVWTVGYPAAAVDWFSDGSNQPDLETLSQQFLLRLHDAGLGRRPSVWVAHSLGGLLTKLILMESARREVASRYEFRHDSVVGLMFLATPHGGAALANVLSFCLNTAKPLLGGALISALGLPALAGWLADKGLSRVCNASDLIEYLRKDNDGRDRDRGRFNSYFFERHRSQRPLEVRVRRETEPRRLLGASTFLVVDRASSDPLLFFDSSTPVIVEDAEGRDHSTICKPQALDDPIAKELEAMVDRVRKHAVVFDLGDAEHNRVAGLAFRSLTDSVGLLSWLSNQETGEPREVALRWTQRLVGGNASVAVAGLETLTQRLAHGDSSSLRAHDLQSIRSLGGALAVLAYGSFACSLVQQPVADEGPAFSVPELAEGDDPAARTYAELLCEVLQAQQLGRHARFVVRQTDGAEPEPAGASPRLIANAISDPASMHDEDHLNDLRSHIKSLSLRPDIRELWLGAAGKSKPKTALLLVAERARAKEHLRGLHARREGLWLDARAPGNAYGRAELRKRVHGEFNGLLPFALRADVGNQPTEEQAATLGEMVAHLSDFATYFDRAERGLRRP